jgi:hypothetical protein
MCLWRVCTSIQVGRRIEYRGVMRVHVHLKFIAFYCNSVHDLKSAGMETFEYIKSVSLTNCI